MSQKQLDHLKEIINNLQLKELGPNHVHINAVITRADMNLLQEIFSLQNP